MVQPNLACGGFIVEDGMTYAGRHLLIDCFGCENAPAAKEIEDMMVRACVATGATVMFHHSHPFPFGGSSGVVILAESHGTFHHWTEEKFVACDIFVCGDCDPMKAVAIIETLFDPTRTVVKMEKRGII